MTQRKRIIQEDRRARDLEVTLAMTCIGAIVHRLVCGPFPIPSYPTRSAPNNQDVELSPFIDISDPLGYRASFLTPPEQPKVFLISRSCRKQKI